MITPNLAEAERLTGIRIDDLAGMREAAVLIRQICLERDPATRAAVLIKGGHLSAEATDLLDDGEEFHLFSGERIETRNTHGTGCTLSAAIAARLGQGASLVEAVADAKKYVARAIRLAPGLGHGSGPLNHFVPADEA